MGIISKTEVGSVEALLPELNGNRLVQIIDSSGSRGNMPKIKKIIKHPMLVERYWVNLL